MYMNKIIVWGFIVLAGITTGWLYFNGDLKMPQKAFKTTINNTDTTVPPTDGTAPAITDESIGAGNTKGGVGELTVTYTDDGFQPKESTVKKGQAVTFVNSANTALWVASAVHPTHQVLAGFDQKASVTKGGAYTYTFIKVGTWKFHNHLSPEMVGTVIVTE